MSPFRRSAGHWFSRSKRDAPLFTQQRLPYDWLSAHRLFRLFLVCLCAQSNEFLLRSRLFNPPARSFTARVNLGSYGISSLVLVELPLGLASPRPEQRLENFRAFFAAEQRTSFGGR